MTKVNYDYHLELKDSLLKSMNLLLSGKNNVLLLKTLRNIDPQLSFALILNWIPEQTEDIYWVLLASESVLAIEVPREPDLDIIDISVKKYTLHEYKNRCLSAEPKAKLKAALEILKEYQI